MVCAIHPFTRVDVPLIDGDDGGDLSFSLFSNRIWEKTIATFDHSENPSA